jgi:hypothetical protein
MGQAGSGTGAMRGAGQVFDSQLDQALGGESDRLA